MRLVLAFNKRCRNITHKYKIHMLIGIFVTSLVLSLMVVEYLNCVPVLLMSSTLCYLGKK